ncbi:MAG: DUF452 family protein [Bacteroidales bacterium]|nr:DUF452 family protein [Bacteroidales bacterium]
MQYRLISSTGAPRLILIFAGWGMDATPFESLLREGYDIMVVWDYRSFYIDWSVVSGYDEICLVAWSMGVFAASQTVQAIDYKITKRIAVNGTLWPVDNCRGIPEAIYYGTHDGLDERNLTKFYRRMCASRTQFVDFESVRPVRDIDGLRDELLAVAERTILSSQSAIRWDRAIVGHADAIFPPVNQRRAWQAADVPVEMTDDAHLIDFAALLDREFVDKSTMTARFARGHRTYEANAPVQAEVVERMTAMLVGHVGRDMRDCTGTILEVGSGSGSLSRRLAVLAPSARLRLWDISGDMPDGLKDDSRVKFCRCDAELAIARVPACSLACIASASTVQWFNSPDRFLGHCARALAPGGILLLSTFTRGNLAEIAALTGNALSMPTPDQWTAMATRYFDIIDVAAWERDLDFETPLDVLRHLKLTGVNSLGHSSRGETDVRDLLRRYPMRLDARYHLTYRPMIMLLIKR